MTQHPILAHIPRNRFFVLSFLTDGFSPAKGAIVGAQISTVDGSRKIIVAECADASLESIREYTGITSEAAATCERMPIAKLGQLLVDLFSEHHLCVVYNKPFQRRWMAHYFPQAECLIGPNCPMLDVTDYFKMVECGRPIPAAADFCDFISKVEGVVAGVKGGFGIDDILRRELPRFSSNPVSIFAKQENVINLITTRFMLAPASAEAILES